MPRAKHAAAEPEEQEGQGLAPEAGDEAQAGLPGASEAATAAEQAPAVVFTSDHASLIVYRKGRRIAAFDGGRFETRDPAAIAALRASALVREVAAGE